jgi:AcrR family transcriptional regulator
MGITERKERERKDLRKAILDAAGELFAQEGIENVSMRKIAEKIEYSPTTIYLYFKDKGELIYSLVRGYFDAFQKSVVAATDAAQDDPIAAIRTAMRQYIDFGVGNPFAYRLSFMADTLARDERGERTEDDFGNAGRRNLIGCIEACIEAGLFRKDDPEMTANVIWSMNHGIVSLLINHQVLPGIDREAMIEASVEATVRAFLLR